VLAHREERLEGKSEASRYTGRATPEEWLPLLRDAYALLSRMLGSYGVKPIVAGAGAYSLHVEPDPTKDIDIVVSRPLPLPVLGEVLEKLTTALEERGWRVAGARIQLGRSSSDWVIQVFVVARAGRIIAVEVFNLLAVRPASLYETTRRQLDTMTVEVLTLESWFASKLADPNGVDAVNMYRLEKAAHRVDVPKLLEILRRLGLNDIVKTNAESLLRRSRDRKLREILSYLA